MNGDSIRRCLGLLLGVLAGACSYASAVDVAPFSERPAASPIATGRYCEAATEEDGSAIRRQPGLPSASRTVDPSACVEIEWHRPSRTIRVREIPETGLQEAADSAPEEEIGAIVRLGGGLLLAQQERAADASVGPYRYDIVIYLATRNAFAAVPTLDPEPQRDLAARYDRIVMGEVGDRPAIRSGPRADIRRFLSEAARLSLRQEAAQQEPLSIWVREPSIRPAHPPTMSQRRDIAALERWAASHAREAPDIPLPAGPDAP